MNSIWQTALAIIGCLGGAGAIISAVVKFSANIIAENLSKKYELKLNKELESFKVDLGKKVYISKARFDLEFSIYGKLSEAFFEMISTTYYLFPSGLDRLPLDEDERKRVFTERYEKVVQAINVAQKVLGANVAFIPERFYTAFDEIRKLCIQQYNMFMWCGPLVSSRLMTSEKRLADSDKCYQRTNEISEKYELLNTELRAYLNSLDVMEE